MNDKSGSASFEVEVNVESISDGSSSRTGVSGGSAADSFSDSEMGMFFLSILEKRNLSPWYAET